MWNTELLWRQCRGIGPHLVVRGEISWFFSSCGGNLGFPLELWRGCSLNTRVFSATSGLLSSFQRHLGILLELWQGSRDASWGGRPRVPFQLPLGYWNSYRFSRGVRRRLLLKRATPHSSGDVRGVWSLLWRWGGELGLFLGSQQGIQTSLHVVRGNTGLNLSHCWEIRPCLEWGQLGVHSTWGSKLRVPLI